jgi:hypothetical protein
MLRDMAGLASTTELVTAIAAPLVALGAIGATVWTQAQRRTGHCQAVPRACYCRIAPKRGPGSHGRVWVVTAHWELRLRRRYYRFRICLWETHTELYLRFCRECKKERELAEVDTWLAYPSAPDDTAIIFETPV